MINIIFPYVEGSAITIERFLDNAPVWLAGFSVWMLGGMIYIIMQKIQFNKMKSWPKFGLGWGLFMFLFIYVFFPLIDGSKIVMHKLLIALPLWLVLGIIFGYVSRKKVNKQL